MWASFNQMCTSKSPVTAFKNLPVPELHPRATESEAYKKSADLGAEPSRTWFPPHPLLWALNFTSVVGVFCLILSSLLIMKIRVLSWRRGFRAECWGAPYSVTMGLWKHQSLKSTFSAHACGCVQAPWLTHTLATTVWQVDFFFNWKR